MSKPVNAKQIAQLLDEYSGSLALYASQWAKSPDDCVQEAFVELAGQKISPENPTAWLFKVVRNRAINELRSRQRRDRREQTVARPDMQDDDPSSRMLIQDEQKKMMGILKGLPDEERELIVLRIWSGLTWGEIAELTVSSSSSAQRRYVAALEKMKIRLESQCLTKPK
ncbi:MAG: RNA polymerase sigma factor [Mariniblastus sp.]